MDSPYLDVQMIAIVDKDDRLMPPALHIESAPSVSNFIRSRTANACVLMSPQVLRAFGGALPHRTNMVIGPDASSLDKPDYMIAPDLYEAIRTVRMFPQIYVLGGAPLFEEAYSLSNTLWLIRCKTASVKRGKEMPSWPKSFELESTTQLDDDVELQVWTNPATYTKRYKAPVKM